MPTMDEFGKHLLDVADSANKKPYQMGDIKVVKGMVWGLIMIGSLQWHPLGKADELHVYNMYSYPIGVVNEYPVDRLILDYSTGNVCYKIDEEPANDSDIS